MGNGETKKMGEGKKMRVSFDGKNKKVDKIGKAQSNRNMILACGHCGEANRSLTTKLLTSREAADFLRISTGNLLYMVCIGRIPTYKLGSRNRYLQSDLINVLSPRD